MTVSAIDLETATVTGIEREETEIGTVIEVMGDTVMGILVEENRQAAIAREIAQTMAGDSNPR